MQLRKDKCKFKGLKGLNVTSQNPEFEKPYFFLPNYCCQKPKTAWGDNYETKGKCKRNRKLKSQLLTPNFKKQILVPEKMVYPVGKRMKLKTASTKWVRNVVI